MPVRLAQKPGLRSTLKQGPTALLRLIIRSLSFTWMSHLFYHSILDADIATQAAVDRNRALGAPVFIPAQSGNDLGVHMYHEA